MLTIEIKKNNEVIKSMRCVASMKDNYFNLAVDMAGGMWNGKDKFTVEVA